VITGATWDENLAAGVVRALVVRLIGAGMFAAFPDLGIDDLVSEGLIAARSGWRRFNPAKATASTFINLCAHRRLIDISRSRGAELKRQHKLATDSLDMDADPAAVGEPVDDLAEWLAETHRAIRRNLTVYLTAASKPRPGHPRTFTQAQAMTLLALKRRQKLTTRGAEMLLRSRPDLCRILDLPWPPSHMVFERAEKSVTLFRFGPRKAG
jgi:DNA-directed RNA polymerase specialized sigma24 family protein